MNASFARLRLRPSRRFRLARCDAAATSGWAHGRRRAAAVLDDLRVELDCLQEKFFADGRRGLLVILQGMDTSGKDSVIRHVFEGVNPQGVRVSAFKAPTPEERSHDYLWRVHRRAPAKGEIVIFNRSHYEDVLVARVHELVPRDVWSTRFDTINWFERELVDEGITVLKFFLNISPAEQRRRLQARIDDPTKRWKLSESDIHERRFWSEYQTAYDEMLARTSTTWAPWYIVPSDHKWFTHLVVSTVLVETMRGMKLTYPHPALDPSSFHLSRVKHHERSP